MGANHPPTVSRCYCDVPLPFEDVSPSLRKKPGQVPTSSVLAYERISASGRIREVLAWLKFCAEKHDTAPTSAEVAHDAPFAACELDTYGPNFNEHMTCLLYVRRGLSDAKRKGLVVNGEKRICRVAGTVALTWKVNHR